MYVVSNRSMDVPGKISVLLPSMDQNVVGFGLPSDLHSNETSCGASTTCGTGLIERWGGAESHAIKCSSLCH